MWVVLCFKGIVETHINKRGFFPNLFMCVSTIPLKHKPILVISLPCATYHFTLCHLSLYLAPLITSSSLAPLITSPCATYHFTLRHLSLHLAPLITSPCATYHFTLRHLSLHLAPLITSPCATYHFT